MKRVLTTLPRAHRRPRSDTSWSPETNKTDQSWELEDDVDGEPKKYFDNPIWASDLPNISTLPFETLRSTHSTASFDLQSERSAAPSRGPSVSSSSGTRALTSPHNRLSLPYPRPLSQALPPQEPLPAAPTGPPPDGGARGWLCVLGGFMAYLAIWGPINGYGVFQTYYQTNLQPPQSPSAISWIGSVQLFLLFAGGMILGPLFDKVGCRKILIPGTLIYFLAFLLTSFSTNLGGLVLSQGVILGTAQAMLFYPVTSAVPQWFTKSRGTAIGIMVTGSAVGGIVWPLMLENLLPKVGFGWSCRILGFLGFGLTVPAWFLVRERVTAKVKLGQPPKPPLDMKFEFHAMMTSKVYITLSIGYFVTFWGLFIPFYYLPDYGLVHGFGFNAASNLLVWLNIASMFGRFTAGFVSDRIGKFNMLIFLVPLAAILLFCLLAITSTSTIVMFAIFYGFLSGGIISLQASLVAVTTPNPAVIGLRLGMQMALCSIGALTGSPIAGALLGDGTNFEQLIAFCGLTVSIGAVFLIAARFIGNRKIFVKY